MLADNKAKWCVPCKPNASDVWIKFYFKRPLPLRGYEFTLANDAPERDPGTWQVHTNCHGVGIGTMMHTETHSLDASTVKPDRFSVHRFSFV